MTRPIVKRKAKRLAVSISVGWPSGAGGRTAPAEAFFLRTRNLNQNGLFVKSERLLPVGSRIMLDIALVNGERPLRVAGKVVWLADPQRHPAYYPGMGVQFVGVPTATKRLINAFLHEKMRNVRDAQELKQMYLRLKEMAARLVEIEEKHPRASHFRKAIDSAIQEIEDVAHMIDREVREVRNL